MIIDYFCLFLADGGHQFLQRSLLHPRHAAEAADELGLSGLADTLDVEQLAADLPFAAQAAVESDTEAVSLVADVHHHLQGA